MECRAGAVRWGIESIGTRGRECALPEVSEVREGGWVRHLGSEESAAGAIQLIQTYLVHHDTAIANGSGNYNTEREGREGERPRFWESSLIAPYPVRYECVENCYTT